MKQMNRLFYRTLSCRTSRQALQTAKSRLLMLPVLGGAVLGTALRSAEAHAAETPWLTQGLMLSAAHRTLFDAFCADLLPLLALLLTLLLCGLSAFGALPAAALLVLRGAAIGNALRDCTLQLSSGDGFFACAVLILPFGFLSALILISAARDVLPLSYAAARFLLRGISDPEIARKRHQLFLRMTVSALLCLLLSGLQTALTLAMNAWLIAVI